MTSLAIQYRQITADLTKSLAKVQKEPVVKRESDYYLANIGNIKSIDDFMKNDRIYRYAMKAFGLDDMINAKAYMRKVLTEGTDSSSAFAMKLTDKRFQEFADTFNFKSYGATATAFSRTQQGTVDRYVRAALESEAGSQSEGLRMALYFQRKISSVTSTYGILADKVLYSVVTTALGLPSAMSSQDIDRQAKVIASRFNLEDMKDTTKLNAFLTRFSAMYDIKNGTSATTSNPALGLIQGTVSTVGQNTLLALQTLRRGN